FHVADGGTVSGAVSLSAIYGFGPNDIYAVGERIYDNPAPPPNFLDSSLIIHFHGAQWIEVPIPRARNLLAIFGVSSNDIWAGGVEGTLYHYLGVSWSRHTPPRSYTRGSYQFLSFSGIRSDEIYAVSIWNNVAHIGEIDSTYYFLNKFQGNTWMVADSFLITAGQVFFPWGTQLWSSPEGNLYSAGPNVYRLTENQWIEVLDTGKWMTRVLGTNERNIFAVGHFSTVYHWNGSDWFQFSQLKLDDVHYSSGWTDGNEVFIIGFVNGGFKTVIAHGK
ncbi:MAG: hypothetical protein QME58_14165, partial [Bacteroidota bacterium]|nr:hypothetical protein [Bacteroidota bacterium]